MSLGESVKVGHSYVNERTGTIREIIEDVDRWRVKYNEYALETGQLIPAAFRVGYKSQLARWAEREARAFEVARLHQLGPHPWSETLRPQEITQNEMELSRATREQTVGHNVLHRW